MKSALLILTKERGGLRCASECLWWSWRSGSELVLISIVGGTERCNYMLMVLKATAPHSAALLCFQNNSYYFTPKQVGGYENGMG